jgi:hypothetical protein
MVDTIKFSQMTNAGNINNNDIMPSLRENENVVLNNPWTFLPPGTTAERPVPSSVINYRLRFNTDEQLYEYYDAVLGEWTQLQENLFIQGPFILYTADSSIPDGQNLGALANGILKQTITTGIATLNIAVNGTDFYGPGFVIPGIDGGTGINNGILTINLASGSSGYVLTSDSSGNAAWQPISASGIITTIAGDSGSVTPSSGVVTFTGASTGLMFAGSGSTMMVSGVLSLTNGGTGVTSVTTMPTAGAFVGWDTNKNLSANSFLTGYATTATAASTTTLTVASPYAQFFTGSTTQIVLMPVTSTLVLGQPFYIVNNSTGVVTVQSSGGNTIVAMSGGTTLFLTCVATSGTTSASWYADYAVNTPLTLPLALASGGTGAVLAASNGGIVYSTASAFGVLAGTATAGLALLSGSSTVPSWSTLPPVTKINIQRVTASGAGTYTPTTGMKYVIVRAQAGGAGGGGAATTSAQSSQGGGGGGGEYIEALFTTAQIGASKAFSIGAGGAGGISGTGNGAVGGNTTFNTTFIITTGGSGGQTPAAAAGVSLQGFGGIGGTGGSVSTGTLLRQVPGSPGTYGFTCSALQGVSGIGGSSGSGGGGAASVVSTSAAGTNALANSGAGASGASGNGGASAIGGVGGSGFLEFIEYISV